MPSQHYYPAMLSVFPLTDHVLQDPRISYPGFRSVLSEEPEPDRGGPH